MRPRRAAVTAGCDHQAVPDIDIADCDKMRRIDAIDHDRPFGLAASQPADVLIGKAGAEQHPWLKKLRKDRASGALGMRHFTLLLSLGKHSDSRQRTSYAECIRCHAEPLTRLRRTHDR